MDPDSAPELGKLLGAQRVLLGNFQKVGETLVVNTRVVEVATGQILPGWATQVRGPASDLLGLQAALNLVTRALQADSAYPAAWGLQAELQARLAQDEMQPEQRDSLFTQGLGLA